MMISISTIAKLFRKRFKVSTFDHELLGATAGRRLAKRKASLKCDGVGLTNLVIEAFMFVVFGWTTETLAPVFIVFLLTRFNIIHNFITNNRYDKRLWQWMDAWWSKGDEPPCIVTHDGKFHCDEVLACYMLKQLDEYKHYKIVRSRDEKYWRSPNVLVDIGGVYDHDTKRFDHHQGNFNVTMETVDGDRLPYKTKLSSAGLVYAHYGKRVISKMLSPYGVEPDEVDVFYDLIYARFIMGIDANDNGIQLSKVMLPGAIVEQVGNLYPRWNEACSADLVEERFEMALDYVGALFEDRVDHLYNHWWKARPEVKRMMENHGNGGVLVIDSPLPWKQHYFALVGEVARTNPSIKSVSFAVVTDEEKDRWLVAPLRKEKTFPNAWFGRHGDELSELTGVNGNQFVHNTGYLAGADNRDAAIALAKKALTHMNQKRKLKRTFPRAPPTTTVQREVTPTVPKQFPATVPKGVPVTVPDVIPDTVPDVVPKTYNVAKTFFSVFAVNFPVKFSESDLRTFFERAGSVRSVHIKQNPKGRYCFCNFMNAVALEEISKLNGSSVGGSRIYVSPHKN